MGDNMEFNEDIFREYDIRGVYPNDINEEFSFLFGKGYGSYIQEKYQLSSVIVGYDNRFSSVSLTDHLIKGLLSTGVDVISIGLVTTPMVYYARDLLHNPASIMVTASHNPKDDNGFKFSYNDGNAAGNEIYDLRDYIKKGVFLNGKGKITEKDIIKDFNTLLLNNTNIRGRKLKVVIDCGNGTTSFFVRDIFSRVNIEPIYLFAKSDPSFPNHHPDPAVEENMEKLKAAVLNEKADLGVAFDGDGDRCCCVDNLGRYVKSDQYMAVLFQDIVANNQVKKMVYDVKCSNALKDQIIKLGGEAIQYRTGASYAMKKVIKDNLPFGGEYSGHIYFNDRMKTIGCGMYAALRMIEFLANNDKTLSEEVDKLNVYYSTPEIKYEFSDEKKKEVVERVKKYCEEKKYDMITIDGVKATFDNKKSWVLVRMSNTGPHVTVRFESFSKERLQELENEFKVLIENN